MTRNNMTIIIFNNKSYVQQSVGLRIIKDIIKNINPNRKINQSFIQYYKDNIDIIQIPKKKLYNLTDIIKLGLEYNLRYIKRKTKI